MMVQQICFGLVYFAEGLTAWQYFETLFARKRKLAVCVVAYMLCYVVAFLSFQTTEELLNVALFLLCNACILLVCYRCSIGSALFYSIILSGLMMVTEWLTALFLSQVYGTIDGYLNSVSQLILFAVASKLLYFLCVRFYLVVSKGKQEAKKLPLFASVVLTGFSLISLAVIFTLFLLGTTTETVSGLEQLWMIISAVGLLLANIMIYFTYQYIQVINNKYTSLLLQQQKDQANSDYYAALQDQYHRQRVLIHDLRHHLEAIKGLATEQDGHVVVKYVEEMEQLPALQKSTRFCSDPVLNAILMRCDEACREKKITFTADIRYYDLEVMRALDKTALFGNLLENAVEAADGAESAFVELTLDRRQPQEILVVTLRNTCWKAPILDKEGNLWSKKEGEGHGIGMKSVNQIVKKYDGQLIWRWDETQGIFKVTLTLQIAQQ